MEPLDLVTVWTTTDPNQARIVRNALRSEGIACEVEGENQAGLAGILEIELMVKAVDADRARSFIDRHGRLRSWQSRDR